MNRKTDFRETEGRLMGRFVTPSSAEMLGKVITNVGLYGILEYADLQRLNKSKKIISKSVLKQAMNLRIIACLEDPPTHKKYFVLDQAGLDICKRDKKTHYLLPLTMRIWDYRALLEFTRWCLNEDQKPHPSAHILSQGLFCYGFITVTTDTGRDKKEPLYFSSTDNPPLITSELIRLESLD